MNEWMKKKLFPHLCVCFVVSFGRRIFYSYWLHVFLLYIEIIFKEYDEFCFVSFGCPKLIEIFKIVFLILIHNNNNNSQRRSQTNQKFSYEKLRSGNETKPEKKKSINKWCMQNWIIKFINETMLIMMNEYK